MASEALEMHSEGAGVEMYFDEAPAEARRQAAAMIAQAVVTLTEACAGHKDKLTAVIEKLRRPELSYSELAQLTGVTKQRVKQWFDDVISVVPALESVLLIDRRKVSFERSLHAAPRDIPGPRHEETAEEIMESINQTTRRAEKWTRRLRSA
jgi:DNA-binding transcriptional regulator YiaG